MARRAWVLWMAIVGALSLGLAAPLAAAPDRYALVIGNDRYESLPVLQKAVNDARAVSQALQSIGFRVVQAENADRRTTNRLVSNFVTMLKPGDQALVFYAGHGVTIRGENILLPVDMPKPASGDGGLVRDEGIVTDELLKKILDRGPSLTMMIVDACRDNPFEATGLRSIGGTRGLGRVDAPEGVLLIHSASPGQAALDRLSDRDSNPNSVFTRELIPLLKQPGLDHVSLAKRLQSGVYKLAGTVGHRQMPDYVDRVLGEIVLVPGGEGNAPAAASRPAGGQVAALPPPDKPAPASAPSASGELQNTVYLDTRNGRITIRLRPDLAPNHVDRIKTLTRQGFYNGLKFHRVIPDFMAQTGDPRGNGTGGSPLPNLPAEFNGTYFLRGTLGMARSSDPNSANSQFFICLADSPWLNGKYTVFGEVIDGMAVVDQIRKGTKENNGAVADPDIIVKMQVAADVK
ncbi:hypothetical protein C2U72_16325 [Prosthecomicrobium hirschii]|nr:hypothetical protein C2U72_16325 [Prosthecomicrobium hirschii]